MTKKTWRNELIGYEINIDHGLCTGCSHCIDICLTEVFEMVNDKAIVLVIENCTECCACVQECPESAITHSSCSIL